MATTPQKNLYGLGFSPLSILNRKHACEEELLANKEVGLIAINGTENNIVSAEYLARSKAHLDKFVKICIRDNTIGKIHKIVLDDQLINTIIQTDNFFVNEVNFDLGTEKPLAIRFNMDIDVFEKNTLAQLDPKDISFEIEFKLTKNGESKTYVITESITDINDKAYDLNWNVFGAYNERDTYSISLDTFIVKVPENFNIETATIVLHDILFAII